MPVEDRLRDPGRRCDVVQARAVVPPLAEEPPGGLDDQLPPLGDGQPAAHSLLDRGHGY